MGLAVKVRRSATTGWKLRQQVLLIVGLGLMIAASWVELRAVAHVISPVWSDLFPQWTAVREALQGRDPYSLATTQLIQRGFYGRVLGATEKLDLQNFVYPAHLMFVLAPFTVFRWPAVRLLFEIVDPLMVAAALLVWMKVCGLEGSRKYRALIFVVALTSWPAMWAYQQQQPTIFIVAAMAATVFLFQREQDIPVGILLSIATVKPNLVLPLLVWLVLQALAARRWNFLIALGSSLAMFLAASEVLVPGWISRWIMVTATYSASPEKAVVLIQLFGRPAGALASFVLILALVVRLWNLGAVPVFSVDFGRAVALLLATTACVVPTHIWMIYNQLLLIPGLFVLLGTSPASLAENAFRRLAFAGVYWTQGIVVICALLSLTVGYHKPLALLPFFNLPILPIVAIALFAVPFTRHSSCGAACEALAAAV